jgi:hypothetical protein
MLTMAIQEALEVSSYSAKVEASNIPEPVTTILKLNTMKRIWNA